jgi:hypothetical protein
MIEISLLFLMILPFLRPPYALEAASPMTPLPFGGVWMVVKIYRTNCLVVIKYLV